MRILTDLSGKPAWAAVWPEEPMFEPDEPADAALVECRRCGHEAGFIATRDSRGRSARWLAALPLACPQCGADR